MAALAISPAAVNLVASAGEEASAVVRVRNASAAPVRVRAAVATGTRASSWTLVGEPLSAALAPGLELVVTVRVVVPVDADAGAWRGALTITGDGRSWNVPLVAAPPAPVVAFDVLPAAPGGAVAEGTTAPRYVLASNGATAAGAHVALAPAAAVESSAPPWDARRAAGVAACVPPSVVLAPAPRDGWVAASGTGTAAASRTDDVRRRLAALAAEGARLEPGVVAGAPWCAVVRVDVSPPVWAPRGRARALLAADITGDGGGADHAASTREVAVDFDVVQHDVELLLLPPPPLPGAAAGSAAVLTTVASAASSTATVNLSALLRAAGAPDARAAGTGRSRRRGSTTLAAAVVPSAAAQPSQLTATASTAPQRPPLPVTTGASRSALSLRCGALCLGERGAVRGQLVLRNAGPSPAAFAVRVVDGAALAAAVAAGDAALAPPPPLPPEERSDGGAGGEAAYAAALRARRGAARVAALPASRDARVWPREGVLPPWGEAALELTLQPADDGAPPAFPASTVAAAAKDGGDWAPVGTRAVSAALHVSCGDAFVGTDAYFPIVAAAARLALHTSRPAVAFGPAAVGTQAGAEALSLPAATGRAEGGDDGVVVTLRNDTAGVPVDVVLAPTHGLFADPPAVTRLRPGGSARVALWFRPSRLGPVAGETAWLVTPSPRGGDADEATGEGAAGGPAASGLRLRPTFEAATGAPGVPLTLRVPLAFTALGVDAGTAAAAVEAAAASATCVAPSAHRADGTHVDGADQASAMTTTTKPTAVRASASRHVRGRATSTAASARAAAAAAACSVAPVSRAASATGRRYAAAAAPGVTALFAPAAAAAPSAADDDASAAAPPPSPTAGGAGADVARLLAAARLPPEEGGRRPTTAAGLAALGVKASATTAAEAAACARALTAAEFDACVGGPRELDFGAPVVGQCATRWWALRNGTGAAVRVALQLSPSPDGDAGAAAAFERAPPGADDGSVSLTAPLRGESVPASLAAASREIARVIAPGATAAFPISFAPRTTAAVRASLTYVVNGRHSGTVSARGAGATVDVQLGSSAAHLAFDNDSAAASVTVAVPLRNASAVAAAYRWEWEDGGEGACAGAPCAFSVAPAAGVLPPRAALPGGARITYAPVAGAATRGRFVLHVVGGRGSAADSGIDSDGSAPARPALLVSGSPSPAVPLAVSAPDVSFGTTAIGVGREVTLLLTNAGDAPAAFRVARRELPPEVEAEPAEGVVSPGGSAAVIVRLLGFRAVDVTPSAAVVVRTRGCDAVVVPVSGGVAVPAVSLIADDCDADAPVDFGVVPVGTTARRRLTLRNASAFLAEVAVDLRAHPDFAVAPPLALAPLGHGSQSAAGAALSLADNSLFVTSLQSTVLRAAPPAPPARASTASASASARRPWATPPPHCRADGAADAADADADGSRWLEPVGGVWRGRRGGDEGGGDGADGSDDDEDETIAASAARAEAARLASFPRVFRVRLRAGASLPFDLAFVPSSPGRVSFELPVALPAAAGGLGAPAAGLRRTATATAIVPQLLLLVERAPSLRREILAGSAAPSVASRSRAATGARLPPPQGFDALGTAVDFGIAVVDEASQPSTWVPFTRRFTLFNSDPTARAAWRLDAASLDPLFGGGGAAGSRTFDVTPAAGTLAPGAVEVVTVSFAPRAAGREYVGSLPLHVRRLADGDDAVAGGGSDGDAAGAVDLLHCELELRALSAPRQLVFDRREVVLAPTPLGVPSRARVLVVNLGHPAVTVTAEVVLGDGAVDGGPGGGAPVPLRVSLPTGAALSLARPALALDLELLSTTPVAFSARVVVTARDTATGAVAGTVVLPVAGVADNCLLTCPGAVTGADAAPPRGVSPAALAEAAAAVARGDAPPPAADPPPPPLLPRDAMAHLVSWAGSLLLREPPDVSAWPASWAVDGATRVCDIVEALSGRRPTQGTAVTAAAAPTGGGGSGGGGAVTTGGGKHARAARALSRLSALLSWLRAEGCLLAHVRAEDLLPQADFVRARKYRHGKLGAVFGVAAPFGAPVADAPSPGRRASRGRWLRALYVDAAAYAWGSVLGAVLRRFALARITPAGLGATAGMRLRAPHAAYVAWMRAAGAAIVERQAALAAEASGGAPPAPQSGGPDAAPPPGCSGDEDGGTTLVLAPTARTRPGPAATPAEHTLHTTALGEPAPARGQPAVDVSGAASAAAAPPRVPVAHAFDAAQLERHAAAVALAAVKRRLAQFWAEHVAGTGGATAACEGEATLLAWVNFHYARVQRACRALAQAPRCVVAASFGDVTADVLAAVVLSHAPELAAPGAPLHDVARRLGAPDPTADASDGCTAAAVVDALRRLHLRTPFHAAELCPLPHAHATSPALSVDVSVTGPPAPAWLRSCGDGGDDADTAAGAPRRQLRFGSDGWPEAPPGDAFGDPSTAAAAPVATSRARAAPGCRADVLRSLLRCLWLYARLPSVAPRGDAPVDFNFSGRLGGDPAVGVVTLRNPGPAPVRYSARLEGATAVFAFEGAAGDPAGNVVTVAPGGTAALRIACSPLCSWPAHAKLVLVPAGSDPDVAGAPDAAASAPLIVLALRSVVTSRVPTAGAAPIVTTRAVLRRAGSVSVDVSSPLPTDATFSVALVPLTASSADGHDVGTLALARALAAHPTPFLWPQCAAASATGDTSTATGDDNCSDPLLQPAAFHVSLARLALRGVGGAPKAVDVAFAPFEQRIHRAALVLTDEARRCEVVRELVGEGVAATACGDVGEGDNGDGDGRFPPALEAALAAAAAVAARDEMAPALTRRLRVPPLSPRAVVAGDVGAEERAARGDTAARAEALAARRARLRAATRARRAALRDLLHATGAAAESGDGGGARPPAVPPALGRWYAASADSPAFDVPPRVLLASPFSDVPAGAAVATALLSGAQTPVPLRAVWADAGAVAAAAAASDPRPAAWWARAWWGACVAHVAARGPPPPPDARDGDTDAAWWSALDDALAAALAVPITLFPSGLGVHRATVTLRDAAGDVREVAVSWDAAPQAGTPLDFAVDGVADVTVADAGASAAATAAAAATGAPVGSTSRPRAAVRAVRITNDDVEPWELSVTITAAAGTGDAARPHGFRAPATVTAFPGVSAALPVTYEPGGAGADAAELRVTRVRTAAGGGGGAGTAASAQARRFRPVALCFALRGTASTGRAPLLPLAEAPGRAACATVTLVNRRPAPAAFAVSCTTPDAIFGARHVAVPGSTLVPLRQALAPGSTPPRRAGEATYVVTYAPPSDALPRVARLVFSSEHEGASSAVNTDATVLLELAPTAPSGGDTDAGAAWARDTAQLPDAARPTQLPRPHSDATAHPAPPPAAAPISAAPAAAVVVAPAIDAETVVATARSMTRRTVRVALQLPPPPLAIRGGRGAPPPPPPRLRAEVRPRSTQPVDAALPRVGTLAAVLRAGAHAAVVEPRAGAATVDVVVTLTIRKPVRADVDVVVLADIGGDDGGGATVGADVVVGSTPLRLVVRPPPADATLVLRAVPGGPPAAAAYAVAGDTATRFCATVLPATAAGASGGGGLPGDGGGGGGVADFAVRSGDEAGVLAAGAAATVGVTFAPRAYGPRRAALFVEMEYDVVLVALEGAPPLGDAAPSLPPAAGTARAAGGGAVSSTLTGTAAAALRASLAARRGRG